MSQMLDINGPLVVNVWNSNFDISENKLFSVFHDIRYILENISYHPSKEGDDKYDITRHYEG